MINIIINQLIENMHKTTSLFESLSGNGQNEMTLPYSNKSSNQFRYVLPIIWTLIVFNCKLNYNVLNAKLKAFSKI